MEWQLKDLYSNINSKEIQKDFQRLERAAKKFNLKYSKKITNNARPKLILEAIKELEKIYEGLGKISSYASLLFAVDTNDPKISKFYQYSSEKISFIRKDLIFFFELE